MKLHLALHLLVGISLVVASGLAYARPSAMIDAAMYQMRLSDPLYNNAGNVWDILEMGRGNDAWQMCGAGALLVASSVISLLRKTPRS